MFPQSLSASATSVFEGCEARYKAEYIDRGSDISGNAASLGSACHETLELWVNTGQYLKDWPDVIVREKALKAVWDIVYPSYFQDREFYADGWSMLRKWIQRENWDGREVISTEEKRSFIIPTSRGDLTFNYIIDRLDRLDDGTIEVVDYKSVRQPIQPERMQTMIQPRAYALAMMIQFKDENLRGVWVTYDLLRYDTSSVYFTREDCVDTWKYLKALAERIYESDGTQETLNPECRFCVRKHTCEALQSNIAAGGIFSHGTREEISNQIGKLTFQKGGIDQAISELQEQLVLLAEQENVLEWTTQEVEVKITASGRRAVDNGRASQILGPEIMSRYGKIGVGDLDTILKEEELTDTQRSMLKQLVKKKYGAPYAKVTPRSPFTED